MSNPAQGNRATRRSWDQYAASAKARTFELELSGPEDVVVIGSPTTAQLTAMAEAQKTNDLEGSFAAILGQENWTRTSEYAAKRAAEVGDSGIYALSLRLLLRDVMDGLGLGGASGS